MSMLFDLPEPELTGLAAEASERGLLEALHARYGQVDFGARRFIVAEHVRSRAGVDAPRTADFIACATWQSAGFAVHGHEIKVSRSDWLRELKDPHKSQEFIPFCHYWWLVVPDKRIVREGELPVGWGLLAPRGRVLAASPHAPKRDALPWPPTRLAALLRAVDKTSRARALQEAA